MANAMHSVRTMRAPGAVLGRRLTFLIVLPAAIGVVTGAAVAMLSAGIEGRMLEMLAALPTGLPVLASVLALPLAMLAALRVTQTLRPTTSELYIATYNTPGAHIPVGQLPGRLVAAVATVGLGGSQGFESPSTLIGASLGELFGRVRRFACSAGEQRTLLIAGASAGIAAVFSSPGVGALYGLEIPFRRDVDAPRLVPAAIAAGAAYATRVFLVGPRTLVDYTGRPEIDALVLVGILLLGLFCGIGARLFAAACAGLRLLAQRGSVWMRAGAAGLLLGGLAWAGHELTGAWVTFGPGYVAADWIMAGERAASLLLVVMLVRTAGTLVCVYGGGGGGVFTSLACTGVFVGELVAMIPGQEWGPAFALLGAACFLAAGYRIPLAGILLGAEESGDPALVVAALVAIAIAQTLMGDASVSEAKVERRGCVNSSEPC